MSSTPNSSPLSFDEHVDQVLSLIAVNRQRPASTAGPTRRRLVLVPATRGVGAPDSRAHR